MQTSIQEWLSNSEEQTVFAACEIAKQLIPGEKIALMAPMGAGKSFLVRAILKSLGVEDTVTSPTFTLINPYSAVIQNQTTQIWHADLYRLTDGSELTDMGFDEIMNDGSLLFAEWADKFPQLFEESSKIEISVNSSQSEPDVSRRIQWTRRLPHPRI